MAQVGADLKSLPWCNEASALLVTTGTPHPTSCVGHPLATERENRFCQGPVSVPADGRRRYLGTT